MAVDLLGYSKMEEQVAIQEAATAGFRSMEHLVRMLSHQNHQNQRNLQINQLDCREITDSTVSKFKKVISILNRTGHARFRRGPSCSSSSSSSVAAAAPPPLRALAPAPSTGPVTAAGTPASFVQSKSHPLTLDFTKPNILNPNCGLSEASTSQFTKENGFSISPPMSSTTSSFMSSITGDGSVSNGKMFGTPPTAPAPAVSAGKPPLSSAYRKKCHEHGHSSNNLSVKYSVSGGRCHCSKRK